MGENKTLFQRIADKEIPADIVYEDDRCVAFRDINPQAPVHILIVPRKPIPDLDALEAEDEPLVGHLFLVAKQVAANEGLTRGYRTVFNNGPDAMQTVPHLHLHLLGGRRFGWPPG
ncbi:MAG: histidine triad nucleotide-binding protein [Bacteroidetes bacterium]|nr:MAG: histidine triad nucleotide-binding protein [Bacteroidota bacterium]